MSIYGNAVGHPLADPRNGMEMTGPINMNGQAIKGLNAPTTDDEAVNWGSVKDLGKAKAGFIYPLAAAVAPEGFLLCDGAAYARSEYPELFAAIGTMYGSGDGATTFNVPDLRNRVPAGSSDNHSPGEMVGEEAHTQTEEEVANHSHEAVLRSSPETTAVGGSGAAIQATTDGNAYAISGALSEITITPKGGSRPFNVMQPTTFIHGYIIATGKGTGISVADIVRGAQEIPLEIKYGGTGETNLKSVRHKLGVNARNLLDNSDFTNPVNQRGVTTFTGADGIINGYVALDRWLFYGTDTTFAVTADGIGAVNGGAATCGMAQRVEPGVIKAGKKYTLAFKGIVTGTVNLSYGVNATSITESRLVETGVNKIHLFTFTAADSTANGMYNIRIRSSNVPSTMDIEWIALYEGEYTAETLPEYQPKGYGAELAECQRYYENSWFGTGKNEDQIYAGVIFNIYSLDARIPLKKHKRVVPTVTFNPKADGGVSWRVYNQVGYRNIESITISRPSADAIMCRLKKGSDDESTWTPNTAATIAGHWEASADL